MSQPFSLTAIPRLVPQLACALRLGFVAGLVGGCAPVSPPSGDEPEVADDASELSIPTRYVDLATALPDDRARARWADLQSDLARAFDDVCGDTFCEGDWSNLEPLALGCSATAKRGDVRECVWAFAASDERVDPASGVIETSLPLFTCRFRPAGTARGLVEALSEDPLRAIVPGSDRSIYDRLGECFDAPEGVSTFGDTLDGPYVDASDALADEAAFEAWITMRQALRDGYGALVGDDAEAPRALRFRCSEDQNTRKLGMCAWSFVGADVTRRSSGAHRVVAERHVCTFRPDATANELAAALAPDASPVAPLDRPLPGLAQSLRDVIEDCW